MDELKTLLVQKLNSSKYFLESNLVRQVETPPNISLNKRVDKILNLLDEISNINKKLELINIYFKEQVTEGITNVGNNQHSHTE